MAERSFYEILDVSRDASSEEIRAAHRKLAKQVHPDVGGSAALFGMIAEAYKTLGNPTIRAQYDLLASAPIADVRAPLCRPPQVDSFVILDADDIIDVTAPGDHLLGAVSYLAVYAAAIPNFPSDESDETLLRLLRGNAILDANGGDLFDQFADRLLQDGRSGIGWQEMYKQALKSTSSAVLLIIFTGLCSVLTGQGVPVDGPGQRRLDTLLDLAEAPFALCDLRTGLESWRADLPCTGDVGELGRRAALVVYGAALFLAMGIDDAVDHATTFHSYFSEESLAASQTFAKFKKRGHSAPTLANITYEQFASITRSAATSIADVIEDADPGHLDIRVPSVLEFPLSEASAILNSIGCTVTTQTGDDRWVMLDSNWIVTAQSPRPRRAPGPVTLQIAKYTD